VGYLRDAFPNGHIEIAEIAAAVELSSLTNRPRRRIVAGAGSSY
jgi:hypothetical protein